MHKTISIDQLDVTNLGNISTITARVRDHTESIVAERSSYTVTEAWIKKEGDPDDLPLIETIYVLDMNSEEFVDKKQAILTVREKLEQLEKYEYLGL